MTVEELINKLSKFPKEMEVVDYGFDPILSVHYKTLVDNNYPYNRPDKKYVCIDIDEVAYCSDTIIEEIKNFLGEKGMNYFKDKDGEDSFDKKYYWLGRQIRNHIIDRFPKVVTWLGDYRMFEDEMYKWTKKAIENE